MLTIHARSHKSTAPKAPQSDREIQACIEESLQRAVRMRQEGFTVTVSGGVATFSGTAKQPGSKGGVYAIASACGATRVINNIVVAPADGGPKKK